MWYEIVYRILSIINYIVLGIFAIGLIPPIFELCVAIITKKKTFPKSEKKVKIAYIIPARNEEDVIGDAIKDLLENQDYPKDLISVYVVANNCIDNTAEISRNAGAVTLILDDPDPNHHRAAYPLNYGIDYILKNDVDAELIIHLDADNHLNKEFSQLMNDAYQQGYDFIRPYEGAINGPQNFFTKACAFFYAFDSRFSSRARERLHLSAQVNGAGATMSRRMLLKCNGYDTTEISDDTAFMYNRLLEGVKAHFVEDAIVYEDLPSTAAVTISRNKRIAKGNKEMFKTKYCKLIPTFFKTGNISLLETFFSRVFIYISPFIFSWLGVYFAFFIPFAICAHYEMMPLTMFNQAFFTSHLWALLWGVVALGIVGLFLIIAVSLTIVFFDYKKLGAKKRSEYATFAIFSIVYLAFYGFSIAGAGNKKKKNEWVKVQRNVVKTEEKKDTDNNG